jgi:glycosyltransferase involved in cell wall biosynthesis
MKVVTVSATQSTGGAARAAYRLHRALRGVGADATMLVRESDLDDDSVLRPATAVSRFLARARPYIDLAIWKWHRRRAVATFTSGLVPDDVARRINDLSPTVVNLHWLGPGFLPVDSLAKIEAPIVWTMHDLWALTGGCHYPGVCRRFEERCGACPVLDSRRDFDLSRVIWRRKHRAWANLGITLVSPSRWLADRARSSSLFGEGRIEVIPNGLDTEVFRPIPKETARGLLNLPQGGKLILFSANGGAQNPIKGFDLLAEALRFLGASGRARDVELIVAGTRSVPEAAHIGIPVRCLGQFSDELTMALVNSAADVFVAPSRQENLANTVMEALACGTPAVAFDIGGMPDLIEPRVNGMLAPPYDTRALADAVDWVLDDPERRQMLSRAARAKVEREYSLDILANRYLALYRAVSGNVISTPAG